MDFAADFPRNLRALRDEFFGEMRREGRGHDRHERHGGRGGGHGHHRGQRFGGPGFGGLGGFGGFGGFEGFPFGGPRRRRGSRASRGDIRLAALALLAEQPMHGYQLMREITTRSDGLWRPSPGAMYPALQQLEDEGLIEPERAEGKRVFRLTAEGTRYVEEHRDEIDAVWRSVDEGVDEDWMDLANTGRQVAQAFMQVVTAGNRRQIAAASELMTETRRRLYRILAEDDDTPEAADDTPEPGTDDSPTDR